MKCLAPVCAFNIQHCVPSDSISTFPSAASTARTVPFAVSTETSLQDRYTDALLREVDGRAGGEAVDTVFFGGGTPSHTSEANLARIVARLRDRFAIAEGAELSLEANPEDVTPDALDSWRGLA